MKLVFLFPFLLGLGTSYANLSGSNQHLGITNRPFVASKTIKGSGKLVKVIKSLPSFSSIVVENGVSLELDTKNNQSVSIEADDNVIPLVLAQVSNGVLKLSLNGSISSTKGVKVKVSLPKLNKVSVNEGSSLVATGITTTELKLDINTGSSVIINSIKAASVSGKINTGSSLSIKGQTEKLNLVLDLGSNADATALTSKFAELSLSNGSSASVNVTKSVSGSVFGGSNISILGNPRDRHINSDASSVVSYK